MRSSSPTAGVREAKLFRNNRSQAVHIPVEFEFTGSRGIIRGIIEGDSMPDIFIPRLIEFWRQGRFPFDKLVRYFPMSEIEQAAHASEKGEVLKAILLPNGSATS